MTNVLSSELPTGHEVLVVEDELRVRNMLSQALAGMGFNATLASTGEEGLRLLQTRSFDILMLDLNLPGMDGLHFLKSVRADNQQIQVIILTGFGDLEAAKTAIHLDVVEFLTKPCTLGNLEIALDHARKRRKTLLLSQMPGTVDATENSQVDDTYLPPPVVPVAGEAMEELERRHIESTLAKNRGNRAAAALELGISLRKLYYRLKQYEKLPPLMQ